MSTYSYVDTILHVATLGIKMGWPDAYLVAAAHCVQALRDQIAQAASDALRIARVGDRRGGHAAQAKVPIYLAQRQQPAVAAQVPAAEVGLDDVPPKAAEIDSVLCTLLHRQSSVVMGAQIPMTTGSAKRLPTLY
jgi:hypothetical protein